MIGILLILLRTTIISKCIFSKCFQKIPKRKSLTGCYRQRTRPQLLFRYKKKRKKPDLLSSLFFSVYKDKNVSLLFSHVTTRSGRFFSDKDFNMNGSITNWSAWLNLLRFPSGRLGIPGPVHVHHVSNFATPSWFYLFLFIFFQNYTQTFFLWFNRNKI